MKFGFDMPLGSKRPMRSQATARTLYSSLCVILLLVLALAMPRVSSAQGITGSIMGTVTDQTGAAVPGATVTALEVGTNSIHTVTTSDIGSYTIPNLPPGQYTVTVSKGNFKRFKQTNISLQIDEVVQANAQLMVGATGETVEVTGAPPVLQTEDSSIGQVIDSVAIQNAPLNGRLGLMGLIAQAPGIQGVGPQDQLATRGETFAAGTGSRNSYGGLGSTLDGVTNAEITLQRAEPEVPSLDAISQFKVLATGAPAEFGQPTQVIVVSSSGTNTFHGELFEYNRSKGTQAKYYYAGSNPRPTYERNEFGGNWSGPVILPHYNGKDKTFFFLSYEGFRLNQAANTITQQPTMAMRSGDLSALVAAGKKIVDPSTGNPFPNNTITKISSVSQQLLDKLMPCKNITVWGAGNCVELVNYDSDSNRVSVHMDHKLGPKDQVRGTMMIAHYGPNPTVGADSLQGGRSGDGEKNTNIILGWTHTLSPSMILDSNGSFFHLPIYRAPQNVATKWESIIPGLAPQYIEGAPHLNFNGELTGTGESGSRDLEQAGQINTSLTKILVKHTIKAGFGYLYDNHWNVSAVSPEHGAFTFNGQYSGDTFADFLLGLPQKVQQGTPAAFVTRNISSQWAWYVQDDWKVLPNLTVNVGLRYDLQWFSVGPYNDASLWDPALSKVVVFGNSYPSSVISYDKNLLASAGLLTLSSNAHISNNPFSYLGRPDTNIAPRVGFAWEPVHNTVLRGAFGLYYNLLPASYVGQMWGSAPFIDNTTYTNSTTYSQAFTMSNAFSGTGQYSGNTSVNAEHPLKTPYTEEYNLALEHQFAGGIAVRVGYVGQHNLKQNNFDGNGDIAPDLNLSEPILTQPEQNWRPISLLGSIPYYIDPIFHSTMNSLQFGAHKRYSRGLAFGAEYQWSRVLGTENINDPTGKYPKDSKGPIGGITPQVLQVNYSYELPIGKGKLLLANASPLVNKIVSGWQVSGLVNAQTGQPFSVTFDASGSTDYPGLVSGRANRVPGAPLYPHHKSNALWFNPAAFTCPSITDSHGNVLCGANYGNSGYDLLRGPNYTDWDMSLQKNTRFMDRYNVQVRIDAFNVINHPNFSVPNNDITGSNPGQISSTPNPPYNSPAYEPRTIEAAFKFNF